MASIKKAIIPIAGLGTRFLPLSKVLPKELWPLVDKPVIQYIVEEVQKAGIKKVIFINRPDKKETEVYFKKYIKKIPELEKFLKLKKKIDILAELKNLEKIYKNISFSYVYQKKPLGDGHALLQAKNTIKNESWAVCWADDVVESKIPCILQLIKVFKQYRKPILALYRIPKDSFPFYGMVKAKKIANRTYQIKKIVEKPKIEESPSNLAIVGKYVLTAEVFKWLEKATLNKGGEILLAEVFSQALGKGEKIYGYEFEGKWLECGNKLAYLKSNLYLSLKHPKFGKELKKYLKTLNV